ncbi:MAG: alcohol dehydrogenase [Lactobacillus sp.]|jgi:hypothetical protein|nr:alcohol dehydrogenase [Lactobacillus sp.]MCI2032652.1 alcohol dehydrogenase [Lactobacillus sp.]
MKRFDLTNQRFGRLVVMQYAGCAKNGNARWLCACDCGRTITVDGYRLRHGGITDCGCCRREELQKQSCEKTATKAENGDPGNLLIRDHVNLGSLTVRSSKNHSGVIGVSYDKASATWGARLTVRGKLVLNKRFKTIEEAIQARREAERVYVEPLLRTFAPERLTTK